MLALSLAQLSPSLSLLWLNLNMIPPSVCGSILAISHVTKMNASSLSLMFPALLAILPNSVQKPYLLLQPECHFHYHHYCQKIFIVAISSTIGIIITPFPHQMMRMSHHDPPPPVDRQHNEHWD